MTTAKTGRPLARRSAASPRTSPEGFMPGTTIARLASVAAASYNQAARTVEAVFSTGARVNRYGFVEVLAVSTDAIDLSRVTLGQVRLLDTHNQWSIDSVLGVVESAQIVNGQLSGRIRFADTDAGRNAEGMVSRGELTGISIGYRVSAWSMVAVEDNTEVWQADKWELMEVSLVPVPADPYAGVRSAAAIENRAHAHSPDEEQDDMIRSANSGAAAPAAAPAATAAPAAASAPAAAPETRTTSPAVAPAAGAPVDVDAVRAAERTRISTINDIGTRAGVAAADITAAINGSVSVEMFRATAFDTLASRSAAGTVSSVVVVNDEGDARVRGMTAAIVTRLARAAGERTEFTDQSRAYAGMGFAEMAAECVGHRGNLRTARAVEDVITRAFHSTSDFPAIFQDAMNRRLLNRYAAAAPTYRRFAAPYMATDFRPTNVVRAGDFPQLQPVLETGEIKKGSFSESKEQFVVQPYGVGFNISRQMIINDNLGAIDQILGSTGDAVTAWENSKVFALLATNPVLLTDNKAIFHAGHGNLAGAAAAIDIGPVGLGRAAMRKQKSLDGIPLNLTPVVMILGPDSETKAEQLVATLLPAQTSQAVPEGLRKIDPVADANIADTAWYLFADPSVAPCFVYGSLEGFEGPRLTTENKFGTQGVGVQLEHDFGVAGIDYRGGYKNAGA